MSGPAARIALLALVLGVASAPAGHEPAAPWGKHRGMCLEFSMSRTRDEGYGSDACARTLADLARMGVDWVSLTPFGGPRSPEATRIGRFNLESDESLVAATRQALRLGLKVMLKPHLWLHPPHWVGEVEQRAEEGWAAFFEAYRGFLLPLARLAQQNGIDALCVGNELDRRARREREWRELIGSVRQAYHGPLTYGANFDTADGIPFWDAVDAIGISAYYPLSPERDPDRAALVTGWHGVLKQLQELQARWKRPIVFTELGYRSADFGGWKHWENGRDTAVNERLQAAAFEAFFDAVWEQPWFGGVYVWKWPSSGRLGSGREADFPPLGKAAEQVLRRRFGAVAARK